MKFVVAKAIATPGAPLDVAEREGSVLDAYRAGFNACVTDGAVRQDLQNAARELAAGKSYLSPRLTQGLLQMSRPANNPAAAGLSAMQHEVLLGLARGLPPADLARSLQMPLAQIEQERSQLLATMGVSGVGGLLRYAVREGTCSPCA